MYQNIVKTSIILIIEVVKRVIACVTIAFHMYKDVCPTAIMLFHCCYPAILLEYPVVVDHHRSLHFVQKYCEHVRYFNDRGIER